MELKIAFLQCGSAVHYVFFLSMNVGNDVNDVHSQMYGYSKDVIDAAMAILSRAQVNISTEHFCMLLCYGRVYPVVRQLPWVTGCSKSHFYATVGI